MAKFVLYGSRFSAGRSIAGVAWSLDEFPGWEISLPPAQVDSPVLVEVIGPEGAARVDRDGIPMIRFPTAEGGSWTMPAYRIAMLAGAGLHGWRFADPRNASIGPIGPEDTTAPE